MRRLCLFLAALPGCLTSVDHGAEVSEAVAYVALLELDENGQLAAGSDLVAWSGAAQAIVTRDDRDTLLVGFDDAQLATLGGAPNGTVGALGSCLVPLPEPVFAARMKAGETAFSEEAAAQTPALGFSAREAVCDDRPVVVEDRCGGTYCEPLVTENADCSRVVDLSECQIPIPDFTFDTANRACVVEPAGGEGCVLAEEFVGFRCASTPDCEIEIRVRAELEPPFDVERIDLSEGLPPFKPDFRFNPQVGSRWLRNGYVHDVAELDDRLVVVKGRATELCNESMERRRLVSVDKQSFRPMDEVMLPGCTTRVVSHPNKREFLSTYTANGQWNVGRFARDGRLVATATMGVSHTRMMIGMEFDESLNVVVSAFGRSPGPDVDVLLHELDSLALVRRIQIADEPCFTAALGRPGELVAAQASEHSQLRIDLATGRFDKEVLVPADPLQSGLQEAFYDTRSNELFVAGDEALFFPREGDYVLRSVYDRNVELVVLQGWGEDAQLLIAGGSGTPEREREAMIAIFDVEARRFVPGVWSFGYGFVTRMRRDSEGRVLVLLAWSGELLRLTPRR